MQTTYDRPTLTDGPVCLRAPVAADAEARFELGNHAEIHHMFGADPENVQPITRAQAANWLRAQEAEPLAWVIDHDAQMVGGVRLHSLNEHDRRASLAIGILTPALLGKGIGTRAMHLIVKHAFGALGLHRLALRVVAYNARAIAAYKKVGFVIEGRERDAARVAGKWHDDVIMGLLAPEYLKARAT